MRECISSIPFIKLVSVLTVLLASLSACAETTSVEPGVYENLLIAVNKDGFVTGYYRESQGEGVKNCEFFFKGEAKNGTANIEVWGDQVFHGEIKAGVDDLNLKVEKGRELPGCGLVLMPEIASGLGFDLLTKAPWNELRRITNEKSFFYSEPKADKQLKAYLIKGDVVGVVASQGDWLQIDYYAANGKTTRRWISAKDTSSLQSPQK